MSVKRKDAPSGDEFPWQEVSASDAGIKKSLKEIVAFWSHGAIKTSQVKVAKVRTRGSRKTKTNTDYEMDVQVEAVLYKCHIKGEGDPDIRDPIDGRVWVTQPCVICKKDDNEETLLLCGTDDPDAFQGCDQSHHTACVGLDSGISTSVLPVLLCFFSFIADIMYQSLYLLFFSQCPKMIGGAPVAR